VATSPSEAPKIAVVTVGVASIFFTKFRSYRDRAIMDKEVTSERQ
jgi:hypothetical protein